MIDPNNVAFYKAKGRRSSRYATYTYSVKEWTYQQIRHYDWGVMLNTLITRSDWPEVSVDDYKSTGDFVYLKSVKYKNLPSVVKKMVRENLETLHNRTEGD